ncbi:MAG: cytidylyltransferase domain-containing protein [Anaerolineales bacterium]
MVARNAAIIQARYSASRLPGKVMADIGGEPMLVRVVERTRRAKSIDKVVVATTTHPADDVVEKLCLDRGYECFRGSQQDVLDRYYQAAVYVNAGIIVRITADCPLIDPDVIDDTVFAFCGKLEPREDIELVSVPLHPPDIVPPAGNDHLYDFAANRLPPPWKRTYPMGLDTEVCTFHALERAWKEANLPHHREHVMPYLYEKEGRFRILLVNHKPDYGALRWAVDTREDLEFVRGIYSFFKNRDEFSWKGILALLELQPELADINANVRQKNYDEIDSRQNQHT